MGLARDDKLDEEQDAFAERVAELVCQKIQQKREEEAQIFAQHLWDSPIITKSKKGE